MPDIPVPRSLADASDSVDLMMDSILSTGADTISVRIDTPADCDRIIDICNRSDHPGAALTRGLATSMKVMLEADTQETMDSVDQAAALMEQFLSRTVHDGHLYILDGTSVVKKLIVAVKTEQFADRTVLLISAYERSTVSRGTYNHGKTYVDTDDQMALEQLPISFHEENWFGATVADLLIGFNVFVPVPDLDAIYEEMDARRRDIEENRFGEQFWYNNPNTDTCDHVVIANRPALQQNAGCRRKTTFCQGRSIIPVPTVPKVLVYNMDRRREDWVDVNLLESYEYDDSLASKLVLPAQHHELLDVLTSDIDVLRSDIVKGKAAGNIVLCKGKPGLGKTLTAEVYAETMHRPLHRIDMGVLEGSVEQQLDYLLRKGRQLDLVMLLDEADVFVMQRDNSVTRNATVATFLRALEYHDGLVFMTTNRPDDIDEAVISRCTAIIDYQRPEHDGLRRVWQVMNDTMKADMSASMLDEATDLFSGATPRDIKNLLSLAVRYARRQNIGIDKHLLVKCASFRGISPVAVPAK